MRTCWHCDRDTHVFSLLLPRGYQARPGSDKSGDWEPQESEAIIYYITQIPESVQGANAIRHWLLSQRLQQDHTIVLLDESL